jgi:hypothetical protein
VGNVRPQSGGSEHRSTATGGNEIVSRAYSSPVASPKITRGNARPHRTSTRSTHPTDPEADAALFDALREHLDPDIELIEMETNINDEEFALTIAKKLDEYMLGVGHA